MKKKIIYNDEKIRKIEVVKDFLPKPGDLVFKEDLKVVESPFSTRKSQKVKLLNKLDWESLIAVQSRNGSRLPRKN